MDKITIYTDGSKFPKYDHIGLGAYCVYKGQEFKLSSNLKQDLFIQWSGCKDKVSNPTAELSSAAMVLFEFTSCNIPVHIEIVADYLGVKEWSEKNWKAKKPYIQKLLGSIFFSIAYVERIGGKVTFRHIRGHQKGDSPDVKGNNESDILAKSVNEINQFKHLIFLINDSKH